MKRELHGPTTLIIADLDQARLSTAGYKIPLKVPKNRSWTTGTLVVNDILVREAIRIN